MTSEKEKGELRNAIHGLLLVGPLWAISSAVYLKLWGWFIVPLGAPEIGLFHMMGITIVLSPYTSVRNRYKKASEMASNALLDAVLLLVLGWLVSLGMP